MLCMLHILLLVSSEVREFGHWSGKGLDLVSACLGFGFGGLLQSRTAPNQRCHCKLRKCMRSIT